MKHFTHTETHNEFHGGSQPREKRAHTHTHTHTHTNTKTNGTRNACVLDRALTLTQTNTKMTHAGTLHSR